MLTIRLNRTGKRNNARFRVVVQEHTVAPGGRHVEVVGNYNPHSKEVSFKEDRIKYWIEKGAQTSDSVYNLLISKGILKGKKRAVKISKKDKKGEEGVVDNKVEGQDKVEGDKASESKDETVKKTEPKAEEPKAEEQKVEEKKEEAKSEKAEDKPQDAPAKEVVGEKK